MEPRRLKNGNMLVPARAEDGEENRLVGDGMIEVTPGDKLYEAWDKWLKQQEEDEPKE